MTGPRIYMDWNATAPLLPEAREAFLSALDAVGNPSSVHGEGRVVRGMIESARRDVAALCGAQPASVIFTSGATEAANMVLTPEFRMGRTPLKLGKLYVSAIEHPAVREGGRFAREDICEVPVTSGGVVDCVALETLLSAHDRQRGLPMVAVMLANNETGIVQPLAEVSAIVRAHGGLLVVDAVQAAGRLPLSIENLGADFLIVSSHKIGGPKGAGALVARGEVMMPAPLIRGGGQEKGHRSGTENAPALVGFGAAARVATDNLEARTTAIAVLRDRLEAEMLESAPDVVIHGRNAPRIANTSFFTLPGLKAETGQIAFDLEGVALSAGSACSSGKVGQSHVLTAMGYDPRQGALRLSIGASTTQAEIERCAAVFAKVASRRRSTGQAA
ncbi:MULTISPECIES: cysteine desulfurase family protein [Sinorhizobium]|uniref:Cysteine desulfurase n=1 Tax=Sinorhizobium americanum TaxID=194963 RepID=A0A2S3YNY3_9HYPH|nr:MULTISPECIES: cysteine desulfurase family protein [Sinorhizobium]PDT42719.1 cysteine desulfurase [Sinorhizobium sp. FG01]POH32644.1 cysteine desulfurase [Sinorhizobium americanum]